MSLKTSADAYGIRDGRVVVNPTGSAGNLAELTKAFETPFYFYNLDHVKARAEFLKNAFVKEAGLPTAIHYALKANANPALVRVLKSCGLQVDVVSGGEIDSALRDGFEAKDVLFSGVAKTVKEIRHAISLGVKQINVESFGELERIEKIALEMKPSTPLSLGLRLNPNVSPETHPYITTGFKENKFGLEETGVVEAVDFIKKSKAPIRLRGLSLHIGSQLLELTALEEALEIGLGVQRKLSERLGSKLDRFDAGGGIGIRYETSDESIEAQVIRDYAQLLKKHVGAEIEKGHIAELMLEPGRWIVARSGVLVTEVQYTKTTQHKSFVITDGGMNLLIRPALYEAEHRIEPLQARETTSASTKVDVVGPICESADFLGRDRNLKGVLQGDRLAVFDAGAYGRTMTSNYNQKGWPAEYVYSEGNVKRVDTSIGSN